MKYFLIILTTLFFISCKQTKESQTVSYTPRYDEIDFGQGGGFTGIEKYYRITSSGDIYKGQSGDTPLHLGQNKGIDWKDLDADIDRLLTLWTNPNYSSGQIYYYMVFRKNKQSTMVSWIDQENEADQAAQILYNKLSQLKKRDSEFPTN